ncbi:MAG: hypothetical protein CMH36_01415 [Microbacterium sp.]|uniref:hypothetical protein n=1 Tax=Microbacterium sp. 4NA327F11 TaxID=2502229 RepID=UPI000C9534CF|nr:hypothetical protein [Microbacterium sp. 4NA327F11]MAL05485.1 hypothetical protein [Microbacterium sp.]MCK9913822.1 hypothetical protein [Microbacteriaceae bacterium K1510]
MANPFLVLGGVVLGIVTAGFGIAQVPGWIASAQDGAAQNDIDQVKMSEASSITQSGNALASISALNTAGTGVTIQQSGGVKVGISVGTGAGASNYVVVTQSASGKYFASINGGAIGSGASITAAVTAAGTLPTGLTAPASVS